MCGNQITIVLINLAIHATPGGPPTRVLASNGRFSYTKAEYLSLPADRKVQATLSLARCQDEAHPTEHTTRYGIFQPTECVSGSLITHMSTHHKDCHLHAHMKFFYLRAPPPHLLPAKQTPNPSHCYGFTHVSFEPMRWQLLSWSID